MQLARERRAPVRGLGDIRAYDVDYRYRFRFQGGEIRTVDTTTWTLDPVPFYTLPARTTFFEDGVLGLELHPDFARSVGWISTVGGALALCDLDAGHFARHRRAFAFCSA